MPHPVTWPLIPIFPLPGVVFFPETPLPLHIFEPRYRKMLVDAWESDRMIGMVQLADGWHDSPEPKPIREIGCAGEIVELESLEDGRSNILLAGRYRFRVAEEVPHVPYRIARVEPISVGPIELPGLAKERLREEISTRLTRLAGSLGADEVNLGGELSDEALVNRTAMLLGLDPDEGYELLAMARLDERYARVLGHMESIQQRLDLLAPFRRVQTHHDRN